MNLRALGMNGRVMIACASVLLLTAAACGDDGAAANGGKDDAGGTGTDLPAQTPPEKYLPKVTGTCPGFADGDGCDKDDESLSCTFKPAGVATERKVRIYVSAAAQDKDGAIVVYWHGLGGMASNVTLSGAGLGKDIVQTIMDDGGIVISPEKDATRTSTSLQNLPWIQAASGTGADDDLLVMDEAVACVIEKYGADLRHIHVTGMSAGGLETGQVIPRRSGYIASAAVYSGGMAGLPKIQDVDNKLPVIVFYGGPDDMVGGVHFEPNAKDLRVRLGKNKQFSVLCDHEMMHSLPPDAAKAGFQFLEDHPYGVTPEPYAKGLPSTFPSYCSL